MSSSSQKRKATGPDTYTDNVWKRTKGTVVDKLERSQPYRFFLSPVDSDPSTHTEDLTLSFPGMMTTSVHVTITKCTLLMLCSYFNSSQSIAYILFISELLDESLGELSESLHINFMVELGWLFAQYFITGQK